MEFGLEFRVKGQGLSHIQGLESDGNAGEGLGLRFSAK